MCVRRCKYTMHVRRLSKEISMASVVYGFELCNSLTIADEECFNQCQHYIANVIQGSHKCTRNDMCETMLGLHALISQIARRKLMFLYTVLILPAGAFCRKYCTRRYIHCVHVFIVL